MQVIILLKMSAGWISIRNLAKASVLRPGPDVSLPLLLQRTKDKEIHLFYSLIKPELLREPHSL